MLETTDMIALRRQVAEVRGGADCNARYEHADLIVQVDVIVHPSDVQFLWHVENLGGPHPGGVHCLLECHIDILDSDDEAAATFPIVTGPRPMSGLEAFFRMRGVMPPMYPLSARCALAAGAYRLRIRGTTYDCTQLVTFADSMLDLYHFERVLPVFREAEATFMADGTCTDHYDRVPTVVHDAEFGTFSVPVGSTGRSMPYAYNELVVDLPSWDEANAHAGPPVKVPSASPMSPQHYWREQIDAMEAPFRELSSCPFGSAPFQVIGDIRERGYMELNHREHSFYAPTLSMMYRLTGEQRYFQMFWFCYESIRRNFVTAPWGGAVTDWTDRFSSHVLSVHNMCSVLVRYHELCGNPDVLAPAESLLLNWRYYEEKHHCQMGRTIFDTREFQDAPIYNMVLAWWEAAVEVGIHLGNPQLLAQAADCWEHFFLPGFQPQGFWYYRPGTEPEGTGDHTTNAYDMAMKMGLSRLLKHSWVRELPGMCDVVTRGLECCIRRFSTESDGVLLMNTQGNYGEDSPIAQLARTSTLVVLAANLARYVEPKFLSTAEAALRGCYTLRDSDGIAPQQWQSAQYSGMFANLLTLPSLGYRVDGSSPERLLVTDE